MRRLIRSSPIQPCVARRHGLQRAMLLHPCARCVAQRAASCGLVRSRPASPRPAPAGRAGGTRRRSRRRARSRRCRPTSVATIGSAAGAGLQQRHRIAFADRREHEQVQALQQLAHVAAVAEEMDAIGDAFVARALLQFAAQLAVADQHQRGTGRSRCRPWRRRGSGPPGPWPSSAGPRVPISRVEPRQARMPCTQLRAPAPQRRDANASTRDAVGHDAQLRGGTMPRLTASSPAPPRTPWRPRHRCRDMRAADTATRAVPRGWFPPMPCRVLMTWRRPSPQQASTAW